MKWELVYKMNCIYKNDLPFLEKGKLWTQIKEPLNSSIFALNKKKIELVPCEKRTQNWINAAKLLELYQDERFETARYFIVHNKMVYDQIAISSEIPNSTSIYPHEWLLNRLRHLVEKTDSYILFSHNHPSGLVFPSENDKSVTKFLSEYFIDNSRKQRFLGHIIVGGNDNFSFTDSLGELWNGIKNSKIVTLEEMNIKPLHTELPNILGTFGNEKMIDFSKKIFTESGINSNENVIAVFSNVAGFITGLITFENEDFYKRTEFIESAIKQCSKDSASCKCFLILPKEDKHLFEQVKYFYKMKDVVSNVLMQDENEIKLAGSDKGFIFKDGNPVNLKVENSIILRKQQLKQQKTINQFQSTCYDGIEL